MFRQENKKQSISIRISLILLLLLCPSLLLAATAINVGDPVTGEITVVGEVDEYTFSANSGDQVYFDAQSGFGRHAIVWTLTDPAGGTLFSGDFMPQQGAVQLPLDGQYSLTFYDSKNRANISYGFQTFAVPEPVSEPITVEQQVVGTVAFPGATTQYSFDATTGSRLYFNPAYKLAWHDLYWRLFNPDGSTVFDGRFVNPTEPEILTQDGSYVLEVYGKNAKFGDFTFRIYTVPDPTVIPIALNRTISGHFDKPGVSVTYTFDAETGQNLYFDKTVGANNLGFNWVLNDPSGTQVGGSVFGFNDFGPISLTASGRYQLVFNGRQDHTGSYSFKIVDVADPAPQTIAIDEFVSGAIPTPGQSSIYHFNASSGDITLHVPERGASPRFHLTAPDGTTLFTAVWGWRTTFNLPQDGEYTLRVYANYGNRGSYNFLLSRSTTQPVFPPTADLIVSSVTAPTKVIGNPAGFDVSWTVTNQGSVTATTWTDSIIMTQGGSHLELIDKQSETLLQQSHNDSLAPGASYTRTAHVTLPDGFEGSVEITVASDSDNQILEEQEKNNSAGSGFQTWVQREARTLAGETTIQMDQADGTHYPAGTALSLSGQVQLFPGAINALFIVDVSGSTKLVEGLDANFDGVTNIADDLNGDNSVGDILDAEIGSIINLVEKMQGKTDDLRVAALPFARESWPIDAGVDAFSQVFVDPAQNRSIGQGTADFEEAIRSAYVVNGYFGGAKLFNKFWLWQGTNFQAALQGATTTLASGPAADRTLVFMLTDGESTVAHTQQDIDALAARGITLFAFQIGGNAVTASLQSLVDGIDATPLSSAVARAVDDPNDLATALASAIELAGVAVNGRGVESLDASGHFFTPVTLEEGANEFVIEAIDSNGRNTSQTITLYGDADSGSSESRRDLSGVSEASFSYTRYDRRSKKLLTDVVLSNVGQVSQMGPFSATLRPVIPAAVELANPSGVDDQGIPLINFALSAASTSLPVAAQTAPFAAQFSNPAEARFSVTLNPLGGSNMTPQIHSTPPVSVMSGASYSYPVVASDGDGQPLSYHLTQAPTSMVIDAATGQINWSPLLAQMGSHQINLRVEDGFGGTVSQRFLLTVMDGSINLPPLFQSAPPTNLGSGASYSYTPQVFDPNGDTLAYRLNTPPAGFVIDPVSGVVSSLAPTDGTYELIVEADDSRGGLATQAFRLTVGGLSANPGVPMFTSTPGTDSTPDRLYLYQPLASDPDGDLLSYSLLQAPAGMTIDIFNGRINWRANSSQLGPNLVALKVEDGNGNFATQFFTIEVSESAINLPPAIISVPSLLASEGSLYSYQVSATDPNGDPLDYALADGPAGMTIHPVSGLLNYTPAVGQAGSVPVRLQVLDSSNALGEQAFTLEIRPENRAPQFITTPVETATVGTTYRYAAKAADSDDRVSYSLIARPAGLEVDSQSGLLFMTPDESLMGDSVVTLRATDERGLSADQTYTLSILADTEAPIVSIVANPSALANIGDSLQLQVKAVDNVDLQMAAVTLDIDGAPVTLDATGLAHYTATQAGLFTLHATATDSRGNQGETTLSLRVVNPADNTPPAIEITSPLPGETLTYLADVIGSITADDLEFYRVEFARQGLVDINNIGAENSHWQLLAEGAGEVSNSQLATFDPTALRNDGYIIRVMAQDFSGNIAIQALTTFVAGDAKLGQFSLEYSDLSMPLAGIPIEITRRYNSFDAAVQGDFGYGWSLAVGNPDLRETVPVAANEASMGLFVANAYTTGTRLYLTNPDGDRVGFTFEPSISVGMLGTVFQPLFTADPGVKDRLEVDDITLSQNADGSFAMFMLGFNYNPENFRLIRPDGTIYHYNQFTGLQRIGDANGNELTITEAGIFHSSGASITFARDMQGRITQITDPNGNPISYTYDAEGDLSSMSYQDGATSSYTYLASPAHTISEIIDPQGRLVSRLEYDAAGRIVANIDALGNRAEMSWDPANFSGNFIDGRGNITEFVYDDRGNIVQETDALGGITLRSYDANNNKISETDESGQTRQFTYDLAGNQLSATDPLGNTHSYLYDSFGNITRYTDPLGRVTTLNHDANGNLLEIIDALGGQMSLEYDLQGQLTRLTDARGNVRQYEYDGVNVNPLRIIHPDGAVEQFEYNWSGHTTRKMDERGVERLFTYDDRGNLTRETDALGHVTTHEYNGEQLIRTVDAQGNITLFEYDDLGRLIRETDANGGVVQFTYDASGNRTSVTDSVGNITRFIYDALNNRVERIDANANSTLFAYDAVGNLTLSIDRNGRERAFSYDASGRQISERWLDGGTPVNEIQTAYDAVGNRLSISDNESSIRQTYDALNRVVESDVTGTPLLPPRVMTTVYDASGNRIQVSDSMGLGHSSDYDGRNRLIRRLWQGVDAQIDFTYDARGDLSSINRRDVGFAAGSSGFTYDLLRRMTALSHTDSTATSVADYAYSYDLLGRLATQSHHGDTVSYGYDASSQLLSADSVLSGFESFAYDLNGNRNDGGYVVGTANQMLSDGAADYDYDSEGNILRKTEIATGLYSNFLYDHRNRLVQIQQRAVDGTLLEVVGYTYDALNRRISTTVGGVTTATLYDGENAWADFDGSGNLLNHYLFGEGDDQLLARSRSGNTDWYLTDRLGTIHDIAGTAGVVNNHYQYGSFGDLLAETNSVQSDRYRFTGREYDDTSGLYYYRARYYDATLGRFISEDPAGFDAGDFNLYRYVGNAPQNATDPSGNEAVEYVNVTKMIYKVTKPAIKRYAKCLEGLLMGVANAVESATGNGELVGEFGECLF